MVTVFFNILTRTPFRVIALTSVVSIVRGEEPEAMVKETLDHLGGLKNILSGSTALIKPNMGVWVTESVPQYVNRWSTTKPEILIALIKELNAVGIRDVSVGDGAMLDQETADQYKESGMRERVENLGARVIDLDQGGHIGVKVSDNLKLQIAESVVNTDNLINVPVMKTHIMTRLTLGLKNLKGVVSKDSKRIMHRRGDLEQSLALLCKSVKPKLTIIDGIIGMEGLGPAVFGKPVKLGMLIAGVDPVAVDAVAATVMGHDPEKTGHIKIASELGLGEINIKNIEIRGIPLEKAEHPFEPAQMGSHNLVNMMGLKGIRYFGWTPEANGSECSGCQNSVLNALAALKTDTSTLQRPLDIVIGPREIPDEIEDNTLLCGDCQAKNKSRGSWVPGCPPNVRNIYMAIGRMTLSKTGYFGALIKRLFRGKKINPLAYWEEYKHITFP